MMAIHAREIFKSPIGKKSGLDQAILKGVPFQVQLYFHSVLFLK